jgi:ubiquinone/menaquinone biosynthesis C-methylase UbiE
VIRAFVWNIAKIASLALLAKAAASVAIQIWPTPTPPAVGFVLNSRLRRRYRAPAATLRRIGLRPGMRALELGPGVGLFTAEAARLLGDGGLLLALDLQMGMLRPLSRLAREAGLANTALGAAEAGWLPLPDASIDLAFLFAVLPMLPDKRRALAELRRVLRPGGILAVGEDLVEPEYVPAWLIRRWCRRAGFVPVASFGNGWCYTVMFESPLQ